MTGEQIAGADMLALGDADLRTLGVESARAQSIAVVADPPEEVEESSGLLKPRILSKGWADIATSWRG